MMQISHDTINPNSSVTHPTTSTQSKNLLLFYKLTRSPQPQSQLLTTKMHHVALQDERQAPSMRPVTVGRWQSLPDVPADVMWGSSAVIGDKTYFKSHDSNVFEFRNRLPSCPDSYCTIVSVNDMVHWTTGPGPLLTTVGGGLQSVSVDDMVHWTTGPGALLITVGEGCNRIVTNCTATLTKNGLNTSPQCQPTDLTLQLCTLTTH